MDKRNLLLKIGTFSTLLFIVGACGSQTQSGKPNVDRIEEATSNKSIWGTNGAEKIVQNRDRNYYISKVGETNISILTCKGESEIDQIVVSPNEEIKYFDARIEDLTSSNSESINKDNIDIFAAKYLKIETIYDVATNETAGNFPDALIPVKAIVNDGSNFIRAGENQSFYVKVNTPNNQKPGIYSGNFFIQLNNVEYKIPVSVEVVDYEVNSVTHSKSLFLNDWQFDSGENDTTQEKLDSYNDELLKYRLSPDKLIRQEDMYNNFDSNFIYRYTEKAYEYMQNDSCTNVCIPYNVTTVKIDETTYYQNIDSNKLKEFIRSYYVKSIASDYDMFKKSSFYCGIIDEPDDRQIEGQTALVVNTFRDTIKSVADELEVQGYTSNPLHNELIYEIRNLKNIVTCAYSDIYAPYVDCWCPKANFYHTEEQRANYASQKEKWWYTCVLPRAPYPTYHIEDGLTSARTLSWMQAEYDVVGNLFWATNVYARYNGSEYIPIEDYYQDGYRFTGVNGDGFLFYPGEPFGSDKPFGSTRLESIRDGLEEYELFYNLKNIYDEFELDDQGVFDFLNHFLYHGTKVIGGTNEMEDARKQLINLLLANQNGSSFLVTGCDYDEANGKVNLGFFAKNGSKIIFNGEELPAGNPFKDGYMYSVSQKLDKESNIANITVKCGDKSNDIHHNLGGKIISVSADKLVNGFNKYNAEVNASLTQLDGRDYVKISVSEINNKRQTIKFTPDFLSSLTKDVSSLSFTFKNISNKDIKFGIGAKFSNNRAEQYLAQNEVLSKQSSTTISADLSGISLDTVGNLEYFVFVFGEDQSEGFKEAVEAYLNSVVISY